MTQKEYFEKSNIDTLLSLRYKKTCYYPLVEDQVPDYNNDCGKMWFIDSELLYKELSKRPHRIRKRDRRLVKNGGKVIVK